MVKRTIILVTTDSSEVSKELAKVGKFVWHEEKVRGPRMSDDVVGIMYEMSKSWKYPILIGLGLKGDEFEVKRAYVGTGKPPPDLRGLLYSYSYNNYRLGQAKKVLGMLLDKFHGAKMPKKFKGGTVVDAKSISVIAATTGLIVPNKGKKSKKMEAIASAIGPPGEATKAATNAAEDLALKNNKKGKKKGNVMVVADVKMVPTNPEKSKKPKKGQPQPAGADANKAKPLMMTEQQFFSAMENARKNKNYSFVEKLSSKEFKKHSAKWLGSSKDPEEKTMRRNILAELRVIKQADKGTKKLALVENGLAGRIIPQH